MANQFREKQVPLMLLVSYGDSSPSSSNLGSSSGGNKMQSRLSSLENDMKAIKTDVAVIKSNYLTISDLHKELGSQTKWIVGIILAASGISLAIAKLIF